MVIKSSIRLRLSAIIALSLLIGVSLSSATYAHYDCGTYSADVYDADCETSESSPSTTSPDSSVESSPTSDAHHNAPANSSDHSATPDDNMTIISSEAKAPQDSAIQQHLPWLLSLLVALILFGAGWFAIYTYKRHKKS